MDHPRGYNDKDDDRGKEGGFGKASRRCCRCQNGARGRTSPSPGRMLHRSDGSGPVPFQTTRSINCCMYMLCRMQGEGSIRGRCMCMCMRMCMCMCMGMCGWVCIRG